MQQPMPIRTQLPGGEEATCKCLPVSNCCFTFGRLLRRFARFTARLPGWLWGCSASGCCSASPVLCAAELGVARAPPADGGPRCCMDCVTEAAQGCTGSSGIDSVTDGSRRACGGCASGDGAACGAGSSASAGCCCFADDGCAGNAAAAACSGAFAGDCKVSCCSLHFLHPWLANRHLLHPGRCFLMVKVGCCFRMVKVGSGENLFGAACCLERSSVVSREGSPASSNAAAAALRSSVLCCLAVRSSRTGWCAGGCSLAGGVPGSADAARPATSGLASIAGEAPGTTAGPPGAAAAARDGRWTAANGDGSICEERIGLNGCAVAVAAGSASGNVCCFVVGCAMQVEAGRCKFLARPRRPAAGCTSSSAAASAALRACRLGSVSRPSGCCSSSGTATAADWEASRPRWRLGDHSRPLGDSAACGGDCSQRGDARPG